MNHFRLLVLLALGLTIGSFNATSLQAANAGTANGVANLSEVYTGQIKLPNGTTISGTAKVTVTATGSFTAKVTAYGRTFRVSGKFDASGVFSGTGVTTIKIGGYTVNIRGLKITIETITDTTGTWLKATAKIGKQTLTGELRKA